MQISGMKFYQDVVHSCFTIEIKVALSLVNKCWFCEAIYSSYERFNTSWM